MLLSELYDFPSAPHDDVADAEAYVVEMTIVPFGAEEARRKPTDPNDPFADLFPEKDESSKSINDDPFA